MLYWHAEQETIRGGSFKEIVTYKSALGEIAIAQNCL